MTVAIVEVMNNTSHVIHYYNQELGTKFDVQPTGPTYGDGGYISTSKYKEDNVPWRSTGKRTVISVDNGPTYEICDEGYKFNVFSNGVWKLTDEFVNNSQYIVKVDDHDLTFIKYDQGLRTDPNGLVALKGLPALAQVVGNGLLAVFF